MIRRANSLVAASMMSLLHAQVCRSSGDGLGSKRLANSQIDFPISGGPIQVRFGHQQTNVAIYMAIGDNPGTNFNIVAQQQLQVSGYGEFCFGNVSVPAGLNVTDGTKATIQVVTNAHGSGGLYQVSIQRLCPARELPLDSSNLGPESKTFANSFPVRRRHTRQYSSLGFGLQQPLQEWQRLGDSGEHLRQPK